jgi:hypothetical protein
MEAIALRRTPNASRRSLAGWTSFLKSVSSAGPKMIEREHVRIHVVGAATGASERAQKPKAMTLLTHTLRDATSEGRRCRWLVADRQFIAAGIRAAMRVFAIGCASDCKGRFVSD